MITDFKDFVKDRLSMSRNILTKRVPASPNKPPPAPKKLPHKGQPTPIDVNLLVQGNYIERSEHVHSNKKPRSAGIAKVTKLSDLTHLEKIRPRTGHLDNYIMQTLAKSPSVDNSYYNKFERLDRDYVDGDTAYKEKGGRVRSAAKPRSRTPARSRDRKRSKSASSSQRKKESFFDVAMAFDNETEVNTKKNSETNIAKGLLGVRSLKPRPESAVGSRLRPRSGRKRRDRSASRRRGRSQCSDSKSERSTGSASWSSSRTSRSDVQQQNKILVRSSRSRTRHKTQASEKSSSHKHPGRDKTPGNSRPASAKTAKTISEYAGFRYRSSASASRKLEQELVLLSQVLDKNEKQMTSKHVELKRKPKVKKDAAIDAVRKANETEETLRQMKEIDKLMYHERRYVSSTLPKLKMIVAPSATPLATLVRQSSAKMLIASAHEPKRNI